MKLLLLAFLAYGALAIIRDEISFGGSLLLDEQLSTPEPPVWVACGRAGEQPKKPGVLFCQYEKAHAARADEIHETRCCTDNTTQPSKNWKKHEGCSVWTGSDEPEMDNKCFKKGTFAQAEQFCKDAGARLCTKDEAENNCASQTGCGHDFDLIWTSTRCEQLTKEPARWIVCGRAGEQKNKPGVSYCENEEMRLAQTWEVHETRCCTDNTTKPSQTWLMHENCSVWTGSDEPEMDGQCFRAGTFAQAEQFCKDAGARLCTKDEVENNCASQTGCNHDKNLIWTSTAEEIVSAVDESASAVEDPHVTNVRGETFDLWQVGQVQFFRISFAASRSTADVIVDALIHNITSDWKANKCLSPYITEAKVSGRSLQRPVTFSVGQPGKILVRIDGVTTQIAHEPVPLGNFSGRSIVVRTPASNSKVYQTAFEAKHAAEVLVGGANIQFTAGKAHINIVSRGLLSIPERIGGLLGEDDHEEAAKLPAICANKKKVHAKSDSPYLLSRERPARPGLMGDTASFLT